MGQRQPFVKEHLFSIQPLVCRWSHLQSDGLEPAPVAVREQPRRLGDQGEMILIRPQQQEHLGLLVGQVLYLSGGHSV